MFEMRPSQTLSAVREHGDFMQRVWHDLHRCPELGFEEFETAKRIRKALTELGLLGFREVATTGTVLDLHGRAGPGPTVLMRADIDALPVQEQSGVPFASEVPDRMHACGHDTHTAMVLTAAAVLKDWPFAGTLRVLFQPSEERNEPVPNGRSGAERCIEAGVLEGVCAAIALHQMPHIPCGQVGLKVGPVLAATETFEIVVEGRAAHAGVSPEAGVDAIVVASELVMSLQTIVSRDVAAADTAVVSVTTIEGGSADNIIADRVRLAGTIRAFDRAVHETLRRGIATRCEAIGRIHGAKVKYAIARSLPPTVNDPKVTEAGRAVAEGVFGQGGVIDDARTMGGEDFAFIAQQIPACFAFLGSRPQGDKAHGLHSPHMIVNPDALPLGAAFLADLALALLAAPPVP